MENLLFALNAVLPIIILMVLGYILKKINFVDDNFIKISNKLVFKVALPISLFINVYDINDLSSINWSVVLYTVIIVVAVFIIANIISILMIKNNQQKGVIIQAFVRSNYAIVGTPLILFMVGDNQIATGVGALLMLFVIPLTNILATIGLMIYYKEENQEKVTFKDILLNTIKNPIIIGILTGFVFLIFREFIIPKTSDNLPVFTIKNNLSFIYSALKQLAGITTPLALIVLGANFEFGEIKSMFKAITVGTLGRVLFVPLLGLGLALLLMKKGLINFGVNEFPALIAFFSAPAAVTSVSLAIEMKGDGRLAAQIVVWTTILSAVTIFLSIFIIKSMGYL